MQEQQTNCNELHSHNRCHRKLTARRSFSVIFVIVAIIILKPLMVNQLLSRADAYSAFGLYHDSVRQCKKVLLFDKDNREAWNKLGCSYKSKGDINNSIETFERAVEIDQRNRVALFELGMIYALKKNYSKAIQYFEQVRKLGPETPEQRTEDMFSYHKSSLDMLAVSYERLKDYDKAIIMLKELKGFYPDYTKADKRLGRLEELNK
jgi:tetratricopeptide (TPR) repeat protein